MRFTYVAPQLVRLHGGSISVESIPESRDSPDDPHGSTFLVQIRKDLISRYSSYSNISFC